MKYYAKFLLITIIAVLILSSCAELPEKGRYYDKYHGFSIKFPYGWDINTERRPQVKDKAFEVEIEAKNPLEEPGDIYNETVVVLVERITPGTTLQEYFDEMVDGAFAEGFETVMEESGDCAINKTPAKWVLLKTDLRGNMIRFLWYCLVKDDRAYVVACNSEEVTFYTYRGVFEASVNSFRFEEAIY